MHNWKRCGRCAAFHSDAGSLKRSVQQHLQLYNSPRLAVRSASVGTADRGMALCPERRLSPACMRMPSGMPRVIVAPPPGYWGVALMPPPLN